ncbi:hypothetical protein H310_06208 [Aphanomyces invadans]|uniref:Uncharacterized protein n=1 Tax=Aphanomyces invadans TaxID=157072 RepID=A0A024U7H8_9STRA|nr:hypothetical protein H310_06208 [Aphanomyces invadans]ETW01553.1 hypothetical protein H310_06208 [Aphanomyces invadans]|eukprot:XP_008869401.1 hypothetical protein H310_06208 [Aphanomyces invadans]
MTPTACEAHLDDDAMAVALRTRRAQKKTTGEACASTFVLGVATAKKKQELHPTVVRKVERGQPHTHHSDPITLPSVVDVPSDRLHMQFVRQERSINQHHLQVYATPGPTDYDDGAATLVRPRSACATLNGSDRREPKPSDAPPATQYNPKPVRPRSLSARISLSRPPDVPIHDHVRFYIPASDFSTAKSQSWDIARRFSTDRYPRRPVKALAKSTRPVGWGNNLSPDESPRQRALAPSHQHVHVRSRTPHRRVTMLHEFVTRRLRAWAVIVWVVDAHLEIYRQACIHRVCRRLLCVMMSRRTATIRAFDQWRGATIEYAKHIASTVIINHFWHMRISARGRLKTRAIHVLKTFLTWTQQGPVVVKQVQRYIDRVRRVQMWWKHSVRVLFSRAVLWVRQWRTAEEAMRRAHLAAKEAALDTPFHVKWNVDHQAEWSQALFCLGPNRLLIGQDISTDAVLVKIELSAATTIDGAALSGLPGGAGQQPFLHVQPKRDATQCLLITGHDLHIWQLKLNLAIACGDILDQHRQDSMGLACQLKLKDMRQRHRLATHEITGILWYCVGDLLRERPHCPTAAMHRAIRTNYMERRVKFSRNWRKYQLTQLKWQQQCQLAKEVQHVADDHHAVLLEKPRPPHFKPLIPSTQLAMLIDEI